MPFHTRLLGHDRMALFSFIHSLNTTFGTTVFEPIAIALAKNQYRIAERQAKAGSIISKKAQQVIQEIIDDLRAARAEPDKTREIETLRKVAQEPPLVKVKLTNIDIFLISRTDEMFLFDIKTAKPNRGNFHEFKRTLLEWAATILAENLDAKLNTALAIPYNPYEPRPYDRWTMRGMMDLDKEVFVAEEFWDLLGGQGAYQQLLTVFEEVGIELRSEIDDAFAKFGS